MAYPPSPADVWESLRSGRDLTGPDTHRDIFELRRTAESDLCLSWREKIVSTDLDPFNPKTFRHSDPCSLELGLLPIGLAHKLRLKLDLPTGQPVRWADVDYDCTNRSIAARREMEHIFN